MKYGLSLFISCVILLAAPHSANAQVLPQNILEPFFESLFPSPTNTPVPTQAPTVSPTATIVLSPTVTPQISPSPTPVVSTENDIETSPTPQEVSERNEELEDEEAEVLSAEQEEDNDSFIPRPFVVSRVEVEPTKSPLYPKFTSFAGSTMQFYSYDTMPLTATVGLTMLSFALFFSGYFLVQGKDPRKFLKKYGVIFESDDRGYI